MWSSLAVWLRWFTRQHQEMAEPIRCSRRCGHISFTDGENLYVWGGHCKEDGSSSMNPPADEIWIFHNKFDSWSVKKCTGELPSGTSGAMYGIVYPYLYVFCGHCLYIGHVNTMSRLHLGTFDWETVYIKTPWVSPRDKGSSWVYKNKIYCFGGYGPDPEYTGLHQYGQGQFVFEEESWLGWNNQMLLYDPSTNEWSIPECQNPRAAPLPRAAHATVVMGDRMFLFGGRHKSQRMNDLHCLYLDTLTWGGQVVTDGQVPAGRSWHTLSRIDDDRFLMYGGFSQTEDVFDDVWIFTMSEQRWTEVIPHTSFPRAWHTAVVTNSQDVFVFGGFTKNILAVDFSHHGITDKIVKFQFQPWSLKELCLQSVYSDVGPDSWATLPKELQEWLQAKRRLKNTVHPASDFGVKGPHVLNGFQKVIEM